MGSSPYPGIKRDSLISFLKAGRIMDKPENCPHAVYETMKLCFSHESAKRPSFSKICFMLEKIIKKKDLVNPNL